MDDEWKAFMMKRSSRLKQFGMHNDTTKVLETLGKSGKAGKSGGIKEFTLKLRRKITNRESKSSSKNLNPGSKKGSSQNVIHIQVQNMDTQKSN
mmetsp:Transcript_33729/g.32764  ORF Transcript_33729/g.32764 Transcript_33729/m.32764 type:complete len:94 (+) Transcript_33729:521-802(+)